MFTSTGFILFLLISLVLYYAVPKRLQWTVLLAASWGYYAYTMAGGMAFLMFATLVSYLAARVMGSIQEKGSAEERSVIRKRTRRVLVPALLLDFGMLAVLKYSGFFILNLNNVFHTNMPIAAFILPLGISYYSFQTAGYLLDVYWSRLPAEKDFFRFALFVSFFPQLAQGPIGRYGTLSARLTESRSFSFHRIRDGLERILWGLFKKMVLADWAAVFTEAIFGHADRFSGIGVLGLLLYTVQLYGNFSGGIDVALGIASLFGVELDENFRRPFFAVSLSDFWTRWHITLGSWMKDYVMYPLTLSRGLNRVGKRCKQLIGKKKGRLVPICISNLIVFLIVGIWHGPSWNNIGWGLFNGIIIAFSSFFAADYERIKSRLHINGQAKWYRVFMILRTFIIINISWFFDCVSSAGSAFTMMRDSVIKFDPGLLLTIPAGKAGTAYTPAALGILGAGCILLFVVSVFQERGVRIRDKMAQLPFPVEFALCVFMLFCIPLLSPMAAARGFIYAQF